MWHVLPELGQPLAGLVSVQGDNQAALSSLSEQRHTNMLQHMEPINSRLQRKVAVHVCINYRELGRLPYKGIA